MIIFRKPVTKIPKRIFRDFNRIDFFGLTLQLRNRPTFLNFFFFGAAPWVHKCTVFLNVKSCLICPYLIIIIIIIIITFFCHGGEAEIRFLGHFPGCKENHSFTACHSGMLKLAFTSPDIISTSAENFLTSRIDSTVLLLFEFLKKHHLPVGEVKNRIH